MKCSNEVLLQKRESTKSLSIKNLQKLNKDSSLIYLMRFRKARKEDISKMLNILKINRPEYPKQLALQELREMFSNSLIRPTYIVAEEKNNLLGFGGYIPSWIDSMVFNMFWVNTNQLYKKQGIGTKLVKNLISRIGKTRNVNAKILLISTRIPNFYKSLGFKRLTPKYDGNYILMFLSLD